MKASPLFPSTQVTAKSAVKRHVRSLQRIRRECDPSVSLPADTQESTQSPETVAFFKKYDRSLDEMCIVMDKFQVTPMLFHLVGVALENCRCNLIMGEIYTPLELVGEQLWAPYNGAWRHEIVLCLRHFGAYHDFNLRFTEEGNFEYLGYQVNR